MLVTVLADTHLRGPIDALPDGARVAIDAADVVLHAGDIVSLATLEDLCAQRVVHAVRGNNDHELAGVLPETLEIDLGGVRVAMIHDSGPRVGRPARLAGRFPAAQLVVFGHSHLPCDELGLGGQRLFNPGSPTQRRGAPTHTIGVLELDGGQILSHRLEAV